MNYLVIEYDEKDRRNGSYICEEEDLKMIPLWSGHDHCYRYDIIKLYTAKELVDKGMIA